MILAYAAGQDLNFEGADICNAFLYGDLEVPVFMEQPTDSSGKEEQPGMV